MSTRIFLTKKTYNKAQKNYPIMIQINRSISQSTIDIQLLY